MLYFIRVITLATVSKEVASAWQESLEVDNIYI